MNKRIYIAVHVYNDGDTELKAIALTDIERKTYMKNLTFDIEKDLSGLINELETYGHENSEIIKSIHYVLDAKTPNTCIIGKN